MHQDDQADQADHDNHASDIINGKTKSGRTPLKLHPMTRPKVAPASTPLRRRRKRLGGKRTVKSCTSCRASHCTLMQDPKEKPAAQSTSPDQGDTIDSTSTQDDALKEIASDAMELVIERAESPSMTDESMSQLAVESPSDYS